MWSANPSAPVRRPWSGALDPSALAPFERFLLRRVGDRGEWVLGVGDVTGRSDPSADGSGPRVGHWTYEHPGMVDAVPLQRRSTDGFATHDWWEPTFMLHFTRKEVLVHASPASIDQALDLYHALDRPASPAKPPPATWTCHTDRARYVDGLASLQRHIQQGDIYEVNHCVQRTAMIPGLDPYATFAQLLQVTDAPFAALYRQGPLFAICMSPERYLRIEGDRIITQPIKGTRKRGASAEEDRLLAAELAADPKERSENIMAVDVARNDLSRVADRASVQVDELCAVKTYPTVHQLVSSVSARKRPGTTLDDIVRASFPMASMTGAPKRRAMELIDAHEDQGRGLFSGTLGFQLPDGTVDLNVVIRTITFDSRTGRASLLTGGAITALSDPELEWEESELKARGILRALGHAE